MSIVSFSFLFFLFISLIIYYIFPRKYRWIVLLISSILFFLISCDYKLIFYLLLGILITYIGARVISEKNLNPKSKKIVLVLTLLCIISELFVLKYINIFPLGMNAIGKLFNINFTFGTINLLAPLGISYYTLSLISYVVDCYWGTCTAQKNFFKHATFACYYPTLISGPIVRYPEMKEELFNERKIEWSNIYKGFTRIIYGIMKKLVIADFLAKYVSLIFSNYQTYSGLYIILGLVCYAIQIYADFSGCMDIVIGASKMYGIKLPENFKSPFFSKSLSEFWRRWHITLGLWGKDYIMYPLLKSTFFQKLGKKTKKIFGKKLGKKIPTILSIFILWLLIGIWHGASFRYIFAAGILPWIYLTIGELFEFLPPKINQIFKIKTDCFSFKLFQSMRTILLMCFIWLFVCSPSLSSAPSVIKSILTPTNLYHIKNFPKFIAFYTIIPVVVIEYLKYKDINVLDKFYEQNVLFKWIVLFMMIITILLFGCYGPGYDASSFIYGGF